MPVKMIRHMNIVCSDLEKSLEFYCDKLGGKLDRDRKAALTAKSQPSLELAEIMGFNEPAQYIAGLVYFGEGDPSEQTVIDVLQYIKPVPIGRPLAEMNHIGIARINLLVDNVDKMYEDLKAKGVKFISPPREIVTGLGRRQGKACNCLDPDGVSVTLEQRLKYPSLLK
jgi:catechol 2,3-dioxygenase-like lactoylglutathione lyase family enzyme